MTIVTSGLAVFSSAEAKVYDYAVGDTANRTVRMNIPDSVTTVRGLLIWANGQNSDLRGMATDPELVAWAESMGFAVIGTSMWSNFSSTGTNSEFSVFEQTLQKLAETSGHPEIGRAPWLPVGQSNGGAMSYGLNVLKPEKTLAITVNKGTNYNNLRPAEAALRTPGILLAGEDDWPESRTAIKDLFVGNRSRGALWAWAEEQATNHVYGDTFELLLPFADEVTQLRYPANASPATAPVTLEMLEPSSGWLTDPDSYKTGVAEIAPYAEYKKDRTRAGWLPSRRIAYIFRAFASYRLGKFEAYLNTGTGPIDWGTPITYSIGQPSSPWKVIEFYEGDALLKRLTVEEGGPLAVDTFATHAGYSVYHSLITFADGSQGTSMPRRVFVRKPTAGTLVAHQGVAVGKDIVINAAAPSYSGLVSQWQINRGAGWEPLNDGVVTGIPGASFSGTTTPTLTIRAASMALNGAQFRVQFTNSNQVGIGITSKTHTLLVSEAPVVAVARGVPASPVPAGTEISLMASTLISSHQFQWYLDGVPIPGATAGLLTFTAGAADAGEYVLVSTMTNGIKTRVNFGRLQVTSDARLANLSARAFTDVGDNILIAGFISHSSTVTGRQSVLIRGSGPSLGQPPYSVPGALPAGELRLFDAAGTEFRKLAVTSTIAESRESVIGACTAQLRATNAGPGVGLVEIFDQEPANSPARLANISARARVSSGANVLIGGFIVSGTTHQTVLVRAVGQGLRTMVSNPLKKATLTLFDSTGAVIVSNTGYDQTPVRGPSTAKVSVRPATVQQMARAGAFLLPQPHLTGYDAGYDSALVLTLPPGAYTVHVGGADGLNGVALMEIYDLR